GNSKVLVYYAGQVQGRIHAQVPAAAVDLAGIVAQYAVFGLPVFQAFYAGYLRGQPLPYLYGRIIGRRGEVAVPGNAVLHPWQVAYVSGRAGIKEGIDLVAAGRLV